MEYYVAAFLWGVVVGFIFHRGMTTTSEGEFVADLAALLAAREQMARMIEVVYLPAYGKENAASDGESVTRSEVEQDLQAIAAAIRANQDQGDSPSHARS